MGKIINKTNYITMIFVILMMPISFILNYYIYDILNINLSIGFVNILHLIIPIELFIYIYNLIKKNNQINKYDILIYMLMVLGIIVTINAVDVQTSIWGAYLREEGLLAIVSYYLLFLNAKILNKDEIKKVINWLFIVGVVQFIYCYLQVFIRGPYILRGPSFMAIGFIGSHNMLGSFCLLLLGLSLMMYFIYNEKKYLIYSVIFFVNLVLTQSSGPFFSFLLLFVFIVVLLKMKKIINWKKILCITVVFFCLFISVSLISEKYCKYVFNDNIFYNNTILGDIKDTLTIFSISNNNIDKDNNKEEIVENYGSGRFTIWKNTMKIVPKYFWLGAGIDNFGYVYPNQSIHAYADKAHNEYLHTLVTQGIFVLVSYLVLLICLFIEGIKSSQKIAWVLLVGFVGYAMQAFMNISEVTVAPFYFMVIGMLAGLVTNEKTKEKV